MKTATFLLSILPLVLSMTLPYEEDTHGKIVRQIRQQSLGKPDERVGHVVHNWNPKSGINPEELGSYLEGDILQLPTGQGRNGIISTEYRWPNGTIYYKILGNFSANEINMIKQAMEAYHQNTCIRFVPYSGTEKDYVVIKSDNSGCWATLGKSGGAQTINLQSPGCVTLVGTAIHELMHTVGFYHEHSRKDRDEYIDIFWGNIASNKQYNFYTRESTAFGVEYDYGSVMHYSSNAFAKYAGLSTISPKKPGAVIGQRRALSPSDILKINIMYNCTMGY